jgi:hypothetical protein
MKKMQAFLTWAGLFAVAIAIVAALPHAASDAVTFSPWLIPIMGVTANKHYQFVEDLAKKIHNLSADLLTWAISNTVPVNTNTVLANLTQISYTNMSARVPTITSCVQTTGTLKLVLADLVITMTGGASPSLRYFDLYNDTPTSPADPLIIWYDYGSSIVLADGEQITTDFDPSTGVIQLA